MRTFAERNPFVIGAVGIGITAITIVAALNYDKLPFVDQTTEYSAYFAEAGGLIPQAPVQVSGYRVGQVDSVELDGPRVLVKFQVDDAIHLGDRTEAAIKTKSLLGAKILEITPRGDGEQSQPIAMDRTRSPYQLPDALGDLTSTISGLDTRQVSDSLAVLANTFSETPPSLRVAVAGIARFSDTLDKRDAELRKLLSNANKATGVLAERSDQIVSLVKNTNELLVQLQSQSAALDQISGNLSAVVTQLKGFIADNRNTLKPALDKLNGVLALVDNRKTEVQKSIKGLVHYATSLGESVSSGPFFQAYVANLLPGQFVQPFIDAAFSDLGLDPNVLAPSERADPQVGQPGTPPLPLPMPRTGQGGEPNLTLPDAITGNQDPNLPVQSPGRYPYREPLPAPPPGGPPPGPPALGPPAQQSIDTPQAPVDLPAPGQGTVAPPIPGGQGAGPVPGPTAGGEG
jgi:phospholipid/cholesterol/gamma-HCH transport system substrate-binding protein